MGPPDEPLSVEALCAKMRPLLPMILPGATCFVPNSLANAAAILGRPRLMAFSDSFSKAVSE